MEETNDACNEGENADAACGPPWPEIVISPCFAEHKIEGQIYQAHPFLYHDTGPWHDWVMKDCNDAKKREFFSMSWKRQIAIMFLCGPS
jgi:hypothetical protein